MSIVKQADVDTATPALALDVSVLLTEPACVLSGQEELLKSVYRFWVKPGSVRNADRIWARTPQNRTYRAWRIPKFTRMVRLQTAPTGSGVS